MRGLAMVDYDHLKWESRGYNYYKVVIVFYLVSLTMFLFASEIVLALFEFWALFFD